MRRTLAARTVRSGYGEVIAAHYPGGLCAAPGCGWQTAHAATSLPCFIAQLTPLCMCASRVSVAAVTDCDYNLSL
jgi:hypothetical protein